MQRPDAPAAATHHLIAYGRDRVREDALVAITEGRAADIDLPGAPLAAVPADRRAPVRLHALAHPFTLPPAATDMRHADQQLDFLAGHLRRLCGSFWKPGLAFFDAYFDAIRAQITRDQDLLAARCSDIAGLIEPAHWAFCAPMPFPRARIRPAAPGPLSADDFIPADLAFHTSSGLLALWVDSGNSVLPAQRRARERLSEAGVRCRGLPASALRSEGRQLLALLGPDFSDFTSTCPLPRSPFAPRPLPRPAAA
ncbi:hypothetical protein [Pelagibacterium montanilacus]|uniref:hypothetical protein n=1 Tax=Pelagibacterium montanilacus TaxID=2185280 RepID=UPI000F8CE461|nr:hypothetical protein [Pelagibacterium montanilacus]